MRPLHNRINREELKKRVAADKRPRTTISFYRYVQIANPQLFRDHFYSSMEPIGVLGRVYIASEGINAQINVPTENLDLFKDTINSIEFLNGIRLNIAVEERVNSFYKLTVKVRNKIVADGIRDPQFNPAYCGVHLNAAAWNEKSKDPGTIVIDMRNHYESEVGHFEGAYLPDADTFREELNLVIDELGDSKEKQVLMYCTGGIRCEKASAWLKYKGFKNVYQLEGGIINYVKQVRENHLENRFKGVNFVFDERLAERISEDVIAKCHQCGKPCDTHTNCANKACHALFIQCSECAELHEGCCSEECSKALHLPAEEQQQLRKRPHSVNVHYRKGRELKYRQKHA